MAWACACACACAHGVEDDCETIGGLDGSSRGAEGDARGTWGSRYTQGWRCERQAQTCPGAAFAEADARDGSTRITCHIRRVRCASISINQMRGGELERSDA